MSVKKLFISKIVDSAGIEPIKYYLMATPWIKGAEYSFIDIIMSDKQEKIEEVYDKLNIFFEMGLPSSKELPEWTDA